MALEPTEEEMQYLTFFTNYCKTEDFTTYRPQFPDDFDLTFKKQEIVVTETEEDEDVLIKKFEWSNFFFFFHLTKLQNKIDRYRILYTLRIEIIHE